jgi:hypothetical protein
MVATSNGIDQQLLHAAQALLAAGRGSPTGQAMSLADFLRQRCQQLLAAYPTSLQEDERLLRQLQGSAAAAEEAAGDAPRREQLETALRYRMGKKRVLHSTLAGLQQ